MTQNANNIFIGFDRDGTLEIDGLPMPSALKQKIVALEHTGINIFFASGKSMDMIRGLANDIGVKPALLCAENGGHIYDFINKQESIFAKTADLDHFAKLIMDCKLPTERYEHKISIWSRKFDKNVVQAKKIIEKVIRQNKLNLQVFAYPDGDGGLDVVPPGIDKEKLLDFIPQDAIIHYFGDSFNDYSLMKNNRLIPHTVANGKSIIKELVVKRGGYVAKQIAGDGVLSILCEIFNV